MNNISLRDFTDQDLLIFKKWLYEPHISIWYSEPLDWINEIQKRKMEFSFLHHFIVEHNGNPIGFCQFYEYSLGGEDWQGNIDINGSYSIDYLIGNSTYLGKGYGTAIVNALIEKIKSQRNANRIIVKPELDNKASCNTLLNCGFTFDNNNKIYILNLK